MRTQPVFIQEVHNNCRQTQETGCAVMAQSYFNWPSPSNTSLNCVKLSSSTLMDYWTAQERQQTFHFPSTLTKTPTPVYNSSDPNCCSSSCFYLLLFLHGILSFFIRSSIVSFIFPRRPQICFRNICTTCTQHKKRCSSSGLLFLVCSSKRTLVHAPLNLPFWLLELRWVRGANKHIYL